MGGCDRLTARRSAVRGDGAVAGARMLRPLAVPLLLLLLLLLCATLRAVAVVGAPPPPPLSSAIPLSRTYDATLEGAHRAGNALRIQDPNQWVTSPPLFLSSRPRGVGALSVSFWWRQLVVGKYSQILMYEVGPRLVYDRAPLSVYIYASLTADLDGTTVKSAVTAMADGRWHHLLLTWQGDTEADDTDSTPGGTFGGNATASRARMEWFVDGSLALTQSVGGGGYVLPPGGVLSLGQSRYTETAVGLLDELLLFSTALSASDRTALWQAAPHRPVDSVLLGPEGLLARAGGELYWSFNQPLLLPSAADSAPARGSEVIRDRSGRGLHGRVVCLTHCLPAMVVPSRAPAYSSNSSTLLFPAGVGRTVDYLIYLAHAPATAADGTAATNTPYAASSVRILSLPDASFAQLLRVHPSPPSPDLDGSGGDSNFDADAGEFFLAGPPLAPGDSIVPGEMSPSIEAAGMIALVLRLNSSFHPWSSSSFSYEIAPLDPSLPPWVGSVLHLGPNHAPSPAPPRGFDSVVGSSGSGSGSDTESDVGNDDEEFEDDPARFQSTLHVDEESHTLFHVLHRHYPSANFFASDADADPVSAYIVSTPLAGFLYQDDASRRTGVPVQRNTSLQHPVRARGAQMVFVAPRLQAGSAAGPIVLNMSVLLSDGRQMASRLRHILFIVSPLPRPPLALPMRRALEQGSLTLLTLPVNRAPLREDDAPYVTITQLPRWGQLYQVRPDGSPGALIGSSQAQGVDGTPVESAPISQWLSYISAYSSYYYDSSGGWNATELLGPPDVFPAYGDHPRAWSGEEVNSAQWIEAGWDRPVYLTALEIFETFNPGHVARILVRGPPHVDTDTDGEDTHAEGEKGEWRLVWSNPAPAAPVPNPDGKANVLSPSLCPLSFPTREVRIETNAPGFSWVQLDAVRVIGVPAGSEADVAAGAGRGQAVGPGSSRLDVLDPHSRVYYRAAPFQRGMDTFNYSANSCRYYQRYRQVGLVPPVGVSLHLVPVNHAPLVHNVSATTDHQRKVLLPLLEADDPDEGDSVRIEVVSLPRKGQLRIVMLRTTQPASNYVSNLTANSSSSSPSSTPTPATPTTPPTGISGAPPSESPDKSLVDAGVWNHHSHGLDGVNPDGSRGDGGGGRNPGAGGRVDGSGSGGGCRAGLGRPIAQSDLPLLLPPHARLEYSSPSPCDARVDGLFSTDSFSFFAVDSGSPVPLRSEQAGTVQVKVYCVRDESLSSPLRISILCLAALGVAVCAALACFLFRHRSEPLVKASSMLFNLAALLGCAGMFLSLIPLTASPLSDGWCMARWALPCLSFTLWFASLFAKTFRVYKIYTNKNFIERVLSNWDLFRMVMSMLSLTALLLLLYGLVSPPTPLYSYTLDAAHTVHAGCTTHDGFRWALLGWLGALVSWGTVLTVRVRNAPSLFNESHWIGLAIYNTLLLSALGVALDFVIESGGAASSTLQQSMLRCFLIVVGVGVSVAALFGTKVWQLYAVWAAMHRDSTSAGVSELRRKLRKKYYRAALKAGRNDAEAQAEADARIAHHDSLQQHKQEDDSDASALSPSMLMQRHAYTLRAAGAPGVVGAPAAVAASAGGAGVGKHLASNLPLDAGAIELHRMASGTAGAAAAAAFAAARGVDTAGHAMGVGVGSVASPLAVAPLPGRESFPLHDNMHMHPGVGGARGYTTSRKSRHAAQARPLEGFSLTPAAAAGGGGASSAAAGGNHRASLPLACNPRLSSGAHGGGHGSLASGTRSNAELGTGTLTRTGTGTGTGTATATGSFVSPSIRFHQTHSLMSSGPPGPLPLGASAPSHLALIGLGSLATPSAFHDAVDAEQQQLLQQQPLRPQLQPQPQLQPHPYSQSSAQQHQSPALLLPDVRHMGASQLRAWQASLMHYLAAIEAGIAESAAGDGRAGCGQGPALAPAPVLVSAPPRPPTPPATSTSTPPGAVSPNHVHLIFPSDEPCPSSMRGARLESIVLSPPTTGSVAAAAAASASADIGAGTGGGLASTSPVSGVGLLSPVSAAVRSRRDSFYPDHSRNSFSYSAGHDVSLASTAACAGALASASPSPSPNPSPRGAPLGIHARTNSDLSPVMMATTMPPQQYQEQQEEEPLEPATSTPLVALSPLQAGCVDSPAVFAPLAPLEIGLASIDHDTSIPPDSSSSSSCHRSGDHIVRMHLQPDSAGDTSGSGATNSAHN